MQVSFLNAELTRKVNCKLPPLGRHPSPLKPKYGLNGAPKAFVARETGMRHGSRRAFFLLKRSRAAVAIADTDGFIDPGDKDFAVADLSRSG
jgi:hypothetical protein